MLATHRVPLPRALRAALPLALPLSLALLGACSDGMQVASVHVKSGVIGPAGGTITITTADHGALAGTAITIPPGALDDDVLIGLGVSAAAITLDDSVASGPAVYVEPIGRTLAHPAHMTVPYGKDTRADHLLLAELAGGQVHDLTARITAVDPVAHLVTFDLDMLGHLQPQATFLDPPDGGCSDPVTCGCMGGACPPDGGPPPDAGVPTDAPPTGCPVNCPVGTMCTPATGTCVATCGLLVCPAGQGCNAQNQCVAQCGMGGAITFLCPVGQVCNFANGTCHP